MEGIICTIYKMYIKISYLNKKLKMLKKKTRQCSYVHNYLNLGFIYNINIYLVIIIKIK